MFKKGDRVRKKDGDVFSTGEEIVTVRKVSKDKQLVWWHGLGAHRSGVFIYELELIPSYPNPPHKHAELIKAWADGADIEFLYDGKWLSCADPSWFYEAQYRIKPVKSAKQEAKEKLLETIDDIIKLIEQY